MRPDWKVQGERFYWMHCKYGKGRWVGERMVELVKDVEVTSVEEPVLEVEKSITDYESNYKLEDCQE